MDQQAASFLKYKNGSMYLPEAVLWVVGVGLLGFMEPEGEHLFSVCLFKWLGLVQCPGCGLGHSIAYIFRGEWGASWQAHPLALPALFILAARVLKLIRSYTLTFSSSNKTNSYG